MSKPREKLSDSNISPDIPLRYSRKKGPETEDPIVPALTDITRGKALKTTRVKNTPPPLLALRNKLSELNLPQEGVMRFLRFILDNYDPEAPGIRADLYRPKYDSLPIAEKAVLRKILNSIGIEVCEGKEFFDVVFTNESGTQRLNENFWLRFGKSLAPDPHDGIPAAGSGLDKKDIIRLGGPFVVAKSTRGGKYDDCRGIIGRQVHYFPKPRDPKDPLASTYDGVVHAMMNNRRKGWVIVQPVNNKATLLQVHPHDLHYNGEIS